MLKLINLFVCDIERSCSQADWIFVLEIWWKIKTAPTIYLFTIIPDLTLVMESAQLSAEKVMCLRTDERGGKQTVFVCLYFT